MAEPSVVRRNSLMRHRGESEANLTLFGKLKEGVYQNLVAHSCFEPGHIRGALKTLWEDLGLPSQYFEEATVETVSKHVSTLLAAQELARAAGKGLDLHIQQEEATSAFFAAKSVILTDSSGGFSRRSNEGVSPAAQLEQYIESKYLSLGENTKAGLELGSVSQFVRSATADRESVNARNLLGAGVGSSLSSEAWRLQCYRSRGVLGDDNRSHLRLYFMQTCDWVNPVPAPGETRMEVISDRRFLQSTPPALLDIYRKVVQEASVRMGPAIHVHKIDDVSEGEDADVSGLEAGQPVESILLVIGHKVGATHSYFSSAADVYRFYGLFAVAKNVETFSNGIIVYAFRLRSLDLHRASIASGFTPAPPSFAASGALASVVGLSLDDNSNNRGEGAPGHHHPGLSTAIGSAVDLKAVERMASAMSELHDRRAVYTMGGPSAIPLEDRLRDLTRDIALHFCLPRTSLTPLLHQGLLSAQEVAYAYVGWKFVYTFASRMTAEFTSLTAIIKSAPTVGPEALSLLSKLRKAITSSSFTESQILDAMFRYPDQLAWCYEQFAARQKPSPPSGSNNRSDGRSSTPLSEVLDMPAALAHLRKTIKTSEEDLAIFSSFLVFNSAVLRTNFYRPRITALSFRLDPAFLRSLYPTETLPYGLFYVIGAEFRGFHVRFADVARGGIRLVKSASAQAYSTNLGGLFDECFSLAATQQRKNKDIPEGGSKGIILLSLAHQDKGKVAFSKYIDSILDLLLLPHAEIEDHMDGKKEILFFGPDENTADLMDWACLHARARGYPYWKAVTTGKNPSLGGVPHDVYGMTTRGVRAFVEGVQGRLGLDPRVLKKVQTGGPDGDLGSNEILQANEHTIAIVDGSGVLCDTDGLNQQELVRLAHARKMVSFFDVSLLSPRGYFVSVEATDFKLPNGTVVPSGLSFRNSFHNNALVSADEFVPCGGRPAAVNSDNVEAFLYGSAPDGTSSVALAPKEGAKRVPRFCFIVEGANLFFTQDARLEIEKRGVLLFKDASANKGGVTSSSLEVLAALVLTDTEFSQHMCVPAGGPTPPFYARYVQEVQSIITENAKLEFECLWSAHAAPGAPAISVLSDALSLKITDLSERIETSASLWENEQLRARVLEDAIPHTLAALVGGIAVVRARLPENYQRALFGSRLASRFLYHAGLQSAEYAFFEYVAQLMKPAPKKEKSVVVAL